MLLGQHGKMLVIGDLLQDLLDFRHKTLQYCESSPNCQEPTIRTVKRSRIS